MKQRLGMLLLFILMVVLLVGLNAASYTQKPKQPDSEFDANRSSFNPGSTGIQAWYTLLAESGRSVTRWQEPMSSLLTAKAPPSVFVIAGYPKRDITEKDAASILQWVARGGRLVLLYREAPEHLALSSADWKVGLRAKSSPELFSVDPADQQQMTSGMVALKPTQPSPLTQGVNAIQLSKFADGITLTHLSPDEAKDDSGGLATPRPILGPPPRSAPGSSDKVGPTVHFAKGGKNFVVELPYFGGSIVLVSDPYVVTNGGISLADNAKFATNLVETGNGTIAFDEFHQGYSSDSNQFFQFFEGTPVVAIFFQAIVLVALVFYSQSRRFARPVPESEPDRLSKLEYISAMAELQRRTKAWDLAVENIYSDFRRRAARLFGIDVNAASSDVLANRIAERASIPVGLVRETLFKCEEIIRGEPTNRREVVRLCDQIRELERQLGLRRGRSAR